MTSCGRSRMPSGMLSRPSECAISVTDDHAAADHRDPPPVLLRQVEDQLDAVNGGAEAGDHNAVLGAAEDLLHARPHGALALGIARAGRRWWSRDSSSSTPRLP